jgi:glyceraldehyde-3-phosphate dehydrogenase (NADP+)
MTFEDQLKSLFIEEDQIPPEFQLGEEVHQREYLSNGEMKKWDGPVS